MRARREIVLSFASSMVARLPNGAVPALLILTVLAQGGSLTEGGVATGVFAAGRVLGGVPAGMLADRYGQTWVLVITALLHSGSWILLARAGSEMSPPQVLVVAAAVGLSVPPLSVALRAILHGIADGARKLRIVQLESSLGAGVYACSPVIVLIAGWSLTSAELLSALLVAAGTACFVLTPHSRRWRTAPAGDLGKPAFRRPSVLVAAATAAFVGAHAAAIELSFIAFVREYDARPLLTALLLCWGFGSMSCRFTFRLLPMPADPVREMVAWLSLLAAAGAALALTLMLLPAVPALCVVAFIGGAPISASFGIASLLASTLGKPRVTEGAALANTGHMVGTSAGAATCGALADRFGPGWGFIAAASLAAAGAVLAISCAGRLAAAKAIDA